MITRLLAAVLLAFLLVSHAAAQPATQPASTVVYEVFVRSFRDSDDADTIGDLRGLTERLDYFNDGDPTSGDDLEVGVLWIMPIFPTRTYHGYDVTDYRDVNPEYGALDDVKKLLAEAHRRGIRVILDVPFNHTSNQHEWFKDAIENRNDKRSWYLIEPDDGAKKD